MYDLWNILYKILDKPTEFYKHLSNNNNLTEKYVIENITKDWDFDILSGKFSRIFFEKIIVNKRQISWYNVSKNPNLTIEWIKKYKHADWNWEVISSHKNLDMDWLLEFPNKPWNLYLLSNNKNFDIEWISKLNYPVEKWSWYSISKNPNFQYIWIEKYPQMPWNWAWISYTCDINVKIIIQMHEKPWNWKSISQNKNLNLNKIILFEKYKKPLEWSIMDINPSFNISWIKKFPYKPWFWQNIINKREFTYEFLKYIPKKFFNKNNIESSCLITQKYIDMNKNINFYRLSINKHINKNIIVTNSDRDWAWDLIALRSDFCIDYVDKLPNKPWNFMEISRNKNLNANWIEKYPEKKWNMFHIANNSLASINIPKKHLKNVETKFLLENENFKCDFDKFNKLHQIMNELINVVYHPNNIDRMRKYGIFD